MAWPCARESTSMHRQHHSVRAAMCVWCRAGRASHLEAVDVHHLRGGSTGLDHRRIERGNGNVEGKLRRRDTTARPHAVNNARGGSGAAWKAEEGRLAMVKGCVRRSRRSICSKSEAPFQLKRSVAQHLFVSFLLFNACKKRLADLVRLTPQISRGTALLRLFDQFLQTKGSRLT